MEAMGYLPPQRPAREDGSDNPSYVFVVEQFIKQFGGFQPDVLDAGMEAFMAEWTYRRWPVVGELMPFMKEAARLAQPAIEGPAERRKQPWDEEPRRERTAADIAEAREHWRRHEAEDRAKGWEPLGGGNGKLPPECTDAEIQAYMAQWEGPMAKSVKASLERSAKPPAPRADEMADRQEVA